MPHLFVILLKTQRFTLYIHTLVSFHSSLQLQDPPGSALLQDTHAYSNTHTLTYRSLYFGQLLNHSVGSLVCNNSGADRKALECLAAAAECHPSMTPLHTHYLPPFQPTTPSFTLQRLKHEFHSHQWEQLGRRRRKGDNSLMFSRGNTR